LPDPTVNWGGNFWKRKYFKLSRARDLNLNLWSGHTAYGRASLIDLYLHAKLHWNQTLFVNRRTYPWTDRRTFETYFIRSIQKSWPNEKTRAQLSQRKGVVPNALLYTDIFGLEVYKHTQKLLCASH